LGHRDEIKGVYRRAKLNIAKPYISFLTIFTGDKNINSFNTFELNITINIIVRIIISTSEITKDEIRKSTNNIINIISIDDLIIL